MSVMDINEDNQYSILSIVAGILHLGNIDFVEHGNYATIQDPQCMVIFCKFEKVKYYFVIDFENTCA